MGTQVPSLTDIVLEFDESSVLHGTTIRCKAVPIKRIGEFDAMDFDEFVAALANEIVISWDLEVDSVPVPISVDGFADLPAWLPLEIRGGWNRGLLTPPKRR